MDDDQIELLEHRLKESLRTSVEAELKRRYSWLGIIGVFLTSGILVSLFNSVLMDTRVNLKVAEALQQKVQKSYIEAENKIDDARMRIEKRDEEFSKSVAETEVKLEKLSRQAEKLEQNYSKTASAQSTMIGLLREQMETLANVIKRSTHASGKDKEVEYMLMEISEILHELEELENIQPNSNLTSESK